MFMLLWPVLQAERRTVVAALVARGFADVSLPAVRLLHELRARPTTIQALAKAAGVTKQFCARELTKLARGGLVLVQDSLTDMRACEVSIRPDGVRALATVSAAKTALDAAMAQRLGKTDAAHLRRIVARLAPKPADR